MGRGTVQCNPKWNWAKQETNLEFLTAMHLCLSWWWWWRLHCNLQWWQLRRVCAAFGHCHLYHLYTGILYHIINISIWTSHHGLHQWQISATMRQIFTKMRNESCRLLDPWFPPFSTMDKVSSVYLYFCIIVIVFVCFCNCMIPGFAAVTLVW